jgi:prepilin-type processing-associated H-X9-DG protein
MPCSYSIYPEYLSDTNIFYCPSTASIDIDDMYYDTAHQQPKIMKYNPKNTTHTESTPCSDIAHWWEMCVCYGYLGWVIDRCDPEFNTEEATSALSSLANLKNVTVPEGTSVPQQLASMLLKLLEDGVFTSSPSNYSEGFKLMDEDLTDLDEGGGNAGGTTVYRIREGIERFLITDINNPAASAKAQSNIVVMFDSVDSSGKNFNHIPGGSNVLYLDGHVEFQRYQQLGKFPCNGTVALLVALVS